MRSLRLELLGESQSGKIFWKAPYFPPRCCPNTSVFPGALTPVPGSGLRMGQMGWVCVRPDVTAGHRRICSFSLDSPRVCGKGRGAVFLSQL